MSEEMSARGHYQAGNLQAAIEAALAEVKADPSDIGKRGLLAELLCFDRQWERADKQIDTIGHQDPEAIVSLSLIRQLIRAEVTRTECFQEGRPPELLAEPTPAIQKSLEALAAVREGDLSGAAKLVDEAEQGRPAVVGKCDGVSFSDFRDIDDVTAGVFEVLTSTGKYYWIPIERVQTIEFRPPERPKDLLWRQAEMSVEDGPYGDVYLPAIYFSAYDSVDDKLRLGRSTDWSGGDGEPARGRGQRTFLIGDEDKTIMEISTLEFSAD